MTAENLPFPPEVLAQHTAALGKTGAGKTTTAKLLVEQVAGSGSRVCILDPVKSDWWGITSSADGKSPGLPFHILGGPHGHVPLHSGAGRAIGEIVASGSLPLSILDMREFEPGGHARFFAAFAHALTQRMRGVLYVVIEEAHIFAPKERSGIGDETHAIHYAKMLATAGRSMGIRLVLLTQRTQALHNALLGSCDTLIAHRLTAPADQKPVLDWLKANVEKTVGDTIAASLASLKTGTGWICSGEAKLFRLVEFPRIRTYDNTATPTEDSVRQRVTTAPVDMTKLRAVIGTAVEEAKANDPEELKKQITALKGELAKKSTSAPVVNQGSEQTETDIAALDDAARAEGYQDGIDDGRKEGFADGMRAMGEAFRGVIEQGEAWLALAKTALEEAQGAVPPVKSGPNYSDPIPHPVAPPPKRLRIPDEALAHARRRSDASAGLPGPQQRILDALAWWESVGIAAPSRVQVAVVARYSPEGGSFKNPLGSLNSAGLIEYPGPGTAALTREGRRHARRPDEAATTAELHRKVMAILDGPRRRILEPLLKAYPRAMTREALATAADYEAEGGSFKNPLGALRSLGLIDYPQPGMVVALPVLFIEGKR